MPFLTLRDGDPLYYEVHGDGMPLALVSGLGGALSFWKPQIAALSRHFRLVLHDHRGTGQSSKRPIDFSVEQMADDLIQLLDHLKIERAHTLEAGLRKARGAFRFDAALFHTRYRGYISKRLTGALCGDEFATCGLDTTLRQVVYTQPKATFPAA